MLAIHRDVLVGVLYPLCHETLFRTCVKEYPILEIITTHPQFDVTMAAYFTAMYGHLDLLTHFVSQGAKVCTHDNAAVVDAAINGHLDVVHYLVAHGADVKACDNDAVVGASKNGHLEVVRYLVSQGCNIRAQSDRATRLALQNYHIKVVQYLEGIVLSSTLPRWLDKDIDVWMCEGDSW